MLSLLSLMLRASYSNKLLQVLSICFCSISLEADNLVEFLGLGLGMPCVEKNLVESDPDSLKGGIFAAGDGSWIEVWKDGPQMPPGIMLQVVVDDADEMFATAKAYGLAPRGPMVSHGEKVYSIVAPGGLVMTFQSKVARLE